MCAAISSGGVDRELAPLRRDPLAHERKPGDPIRRRRESAGGDGLVHATTSSARSTMATTAIVSGTARIVSISSVMTVTASTRLPHRRAWTRRSAGQVATTTMVAQTTAGRNGRST